MKSKLILIIVTLQLIVITFIARNIYLKKTDILGSADINPIKKENVQENPQSNLKFFYEPPPHSIENPNDWIPYKATYSINHDTLNERFEYDVEKPVKTFRIVTLGDSWTYGLYVDTRDNWSERLEDLLNSELKCNAYEKFEVINLGYQGYDLEYAMERLKLRGLKYNPDLVLWLIKIDDIYQINELILPKESEVAKKLTSQDYIKSYENGRNYPSYYEAYRWYEKNYSKEEILKKQLKILENFPKEYINPLVFLTFPIKTNWGADTEGKELIDKFTKTRAGTTLETVIPDISSNSNYHFETDKHPNKEGHEAIAKSVFESLRNQGLLLCN